MELKYIEKQSKQLQTEWGAEDVGLAFRALEFGGEAGELLNIVKKIERENMGLKGSSVTWPQVRDELADCFISLVNLANSLGISLESAVKAKFNADSEKHGLKTRL